MIAKSIVSPTLLFALAFTNLPALLSATPSSAYPDGFYFNSPGTPAGSAYLTAWDAAANIRTIELGSYSGGLYLHADHDESAAATGDGGVNIQGNPISLVLSSSSVNPDNANLNVWKASTWGVGQPLLNINAANGNTTFTNSNVAINNVTLTVGGSAVISNSTAPGVISGLGFLKNTDVNSALNLATPPTSAAWKAVYVSRGNVSPLPGQTEGGLFALGLDGTSAASGSSSIASGYRTTASGMLAIALGTDSTATSPFATAIGQNANATGQFSLAVGNGVTASGSYSFVRGYNSSSAGYAANAMGWGTSAKARVETAVGSYNLESSPTSALIINGLYGLFRVGNGTSTVRSDAMTVLMDGQTTLTNKEWKIATTANPGNPATALADPSSATDSGGNALVVDGHTVLNGKVTMSVPQGDILMGIFGSN